MKWITPEKIKVDRVARQWLIRNAVYDALYRECKRRITKPAELARSTKTKGISMFEILSAIR
jgi:hypothetical protein